jgi:hypothetical protein
MIDLVVLFGSSGLTALITGGLTYLGVTRKYKSSDRKMLSEEISQHMDRLELRVVELEESYKQSCEENLRLLGRVIVLEAILTSKGIKVPDGA